MQGPPIRPSSNLENETPSDTFCSASMYESSGSQFFRTTNGIQSGPDAFDGSRFVTLYNFLYINLV